MHYSVENAPRYYQTITVPDGELTSCIRLAGFGRNISGIACDFPKGYTWNPHAHAHEQLCICVSGELSYTIEGETFLMHAGDTVFLPSNAMHTATAVEDTTIVDIFTPVRFDQMAWFDDSIHAEFPAYWEKNDAYVYTDRPVFYEADKVYKAGQDVFFPDGVKKQPTWNCGSGCNISAVEWDMEPGGFWKPHKHMQEQITVCIKGSCEYVIDDEKFILKAGDTCYLPGYAVHEGRALEECRVVDVFTPVRKDLLDLCTEK